MEAAKALLVPVQGFRISAGASTHDTGRAWSAAAFGPSHLGVWERQWRVALRRLRHHWVGKLGGVCRLQSLAGEKLELRDRRWLRERGLWYVREMTSFAATYSRVPATAQTREGSVF